MPESFHIRKPEEQLADEIRRRLRNGVWNDRVPGIMRLTREFSIGRPVVERAFALLTESGELIAEGPGKALRAREKTVPARKTGALIAYKIQDDDRSGDLHAFMDAVEPVLPGPVNRICSDPDEAPEAVVARLLDSDAGVFIIQNHHAEVADALAAAGRRVIAVGGPGVTRIAPRLAVNHEAMVREAFRRAFAQGHLRVTLPVWRRHPEVAVRLRTWIAEEYVAAGLRHSPEFDAPIIADESPEALHACLKELFRHTPPTAIVSHDMPQWIATVSTLCLLRKSIPGDVSTILLMNVPELAAANPAQAHFRHPVPGLVREVKRLLRGKTPAPGIAVYLDPVWVSGGTLSPPSAR